MYSHNYLLNIWETSAIIKFKTGSPQMTGVWSFRDSFAVNWNNLLCVSKLLLVFYTELSIRVIAMSQNTWKHKYVFCAFLSRTVQHEIR